MKKVTIKSIFFLAFMFVFTTILNAVPAYPDPVVMTQPDGKTLTVMIKGDERINWYESMDGYTILINKLGYLSYAQLDENGNLQSTDIIATDIENRDIVATSFLNTIEKNLFYSDIQVQLMLKVWEIEDGALNVPKGERALSGDVKTICVLVQFSDKQMKYQKSDFEGLFNQMGYSENGAKGSVSDYFKEVSYGDINLTITLCGIYDAPQKRSYYSADNDAKVGELARWLAQKVVAEPGIELKDYEYNNKGEVNGFHFIFAGTGRANSNDTEAIWPHKSEIYPIVYQGSTGKFIKTYSCSPELRPGTAQLPETIGVICHEMTHALFMIKDYYDTNYATGGQYDGTARWDLMAEGNYNGSPSGSCPAHPNMHIKSLLGWVKVEELNYRRTITNMANAAENPVAYRINTSTYNEYYLLENRQKVKFDASIPGQGLIIYHVHSQWNQGCINCTHPQRMYPVSTRQPGALPTGSQSTYGSAGSYCAFPGSGNIIRTELSDKSIPSMLSWAGRETKKPISDIKHENGLISFEFMDPTVGIDDMETTNSALLVIPNPASEYIDIQVSSYKLQVTGIEFYNVFGQLVKSVPFNAELNENAAMQRISITDLNKGIYFIKIGNEMAKLVVQ